jgi:hypothetical protein
MQAAGDEEKRRRPPELRMRVGRPPGSRMRGEAGSTAR